MLNDAEAAAFFEELVRFNLYISLDEFLQRYRRGEYKSACNNPRLLEVLMMIPQALRNPDTK
jgi:hypothetical protein